MPLLMIVFATGLVTASIAAGFAARSRAGRSASTLVPLGPDCPSSWPAIARALLRPRASIIALIICLMLVEAVLSLAAPWPLALVVEYVVSRHNVPAWLGSLGHLSVTRFALIAAVAGLILLGSAALVGYLVTYLVGALSEQTSSRLRVMTLSHVLRVTPGRSAEYPVGELANRISADTARAADILIALVETLIPELLVLIGMIAITGLLDWRLTLVTVGIIPLYAITSVRRNRAITPAQRRARAGAGELAAISTELLSRIRAVHTFDRVHAETERYAAASDELADASLTALNASARFAPVTQTLPGLGLAAALVTGTIEITSGRLSVGALLVILAYLSSMTGPVRSLAGLSGAIAQGAASRERVAELLRIPVLGAKPVNPPQAMPTGNRPIGPSVGSRPGCAVGFDNVRFSYRPGRPVLGGISLAIVAGEFVSLTGPSGTGKSTLLSLLMRLAEPDGGLITIDGQDISSLPLSRLRQLVTLVPQDPWLHSGTVADNIGYGQPGTTRRQIVAAAVSAGVDSFARLLPDGYDTPVGTDGGKLSGGEQRRIAVARALLRDTPVLLLDEPTAGLDVATEAQLITDLLAARLGQTLILVTHRPAIAAMADRELRLEGGTVQHRLPNSGRRQLALA